MLVVPYALRTHEGRSGIPRWFSGRMARTVTVPPVTGVLIRARSVQMICNSSTAFCAVFRCFAGLLIHQLDISRLPGLVVPRLGWPIQTQDHVPSLARHGLYPVALLACRRLGAEVDSRRAIGALFQIGKRAVETRADLVGFEQ
jgi:hypothetical protein